MKIGIINKSKHENPSYKTIGSSGMDIKANIDKAILLNPGDRITISTGIFLEIPNSFEAQIRPRSGLAVKYGITVLNTPGTIDSDYRGEIAVILINLSKKIFKVQDGDRIAQLVVAKVEKISWNKIELLTETKRGVGGFGSTGKN